jgi:hypothetical protein
VVLSYPQDAHRIAAVLLAETQVAHQAAAVMLSAGPQAGWGALQHSSSICNCMRWARLGAAVVDTSARFLHKEQTATCCLFFTVELQPTNRCKTGVWQAGACQPGRCDEPAATSTCCNINYPIHMPHYAIQQHSRPT